MIVLFELQHCYLHEINKKYKYNLNIGNKHALNLYTGGKIHL